MRTGMALAKRNGDLRMKQRRLETAVFDDFP